LQVLPYLMSKVAMVLILAVYQAAIILLFKKFAINFPEGTDFGGMFITLLLATIAGMMMGLVVSAISPNQNVAPMLTILFLVPQITFGGGTVPVPALHPIGQAVSNFTLTRWSFETLVTITKVGKPIADDSCWQKTKPDRDRLTDDEKTKECKCLGPNIFEECKLPGIWGKHVAAVDQAEPQKPADPGAFPSNPQEIENYKKKADDYKKGMDVWQEKYRVWKADRGGAIGKAEGIVSSIHDDFGDTLNVKVYQNWGILIAQIAIMFGMLIGAQKLKDV
jgi:ABC transport system ATP-binding/permease protein